MNYNKNIFKVHIISYNSFESLNDGFVSLIYHFTTPTFVKHSKLFEDSLILFEIYLFKSTDNFVFISMYFIYYICQEYKSIILYIIYQEYKCIYYIRNISLYFIYYSRPIFYILQYIRNTSIFYIL